jgi:hypothetical protein
MEQRGLLPDERKGGMPMKTKVYVLLEDNEFEYSRVHSVYASKELLVKALLETKNSAFYNNAMFYWKKTDVCRDGEPIDKSKHDSFETFLMEYLERELINDGSAYVYESEVICE